MLRPPGASVSTSALKATVVFKSGEEEEEDDDEAKHSAAQL